MSGKDSSIDTASVFMDDWPQLTDANLISRAGMVTAQLSKPCRCVPRECRL